MSNDNVGKRARKATAGLAKVENTERVIRLEDLCKEPLPGLPDDVTLEAICTKIPWRGLEILSSVSRGWEQTIQSGDIHDAKVCSHSAETFAVVNYTKPGLVGSSKIHALGLYSVRGKCWYDLPPIPFGGDIQCAFQYIALDGKIYAMGGLKYTMDPDIELGSAEVYVLDLTRQRKWTQCASMQEPRLSFGVGILHGKIYVSGGFSDFSPVYVCEVYDYDPKADTWFKTDSSLESRIYHQVATVGEELWIYAGLFYDNIEEMAEEEVDEDDNTDEFPSKVLLYHSVTMSGAP